MSGDGGWTIRALRRDDLAVFRPLRLEALRCHPEAFGSSFEEEQGEDLSRMIGERPNVTLGGFGDGVLTGIAGLVVPARMKQRHKGHIVGVYVTPRWRGSGLAGGLLDGLIEAGRSSGLTLLTLSVTVGNTAARRVYLRAGFEVYGVEPLSLRIGSAFWDEELMALRL